MDRRDIHYSDTPSVPEPETVHICIIDADAQFSNMLSHLLAEELPRMVNVVGTYEGIPDLLEVQYEVSLVIFDPELEDFRKLASAIWQMHECFGERAHLVAHADAWTDDHALLKQELRLLGVEMGFRRFDLRRCIKLVTKLAMREPIELWLKEFAT